jgi:hypothetical protein
MGPEIGIFARVMGPWGRERWSPTGDSFVVALEGGTAGVLAWRLGGSAGTFIAAPEPHRYWHSIGAWSPDGRDLVMAWGDDRTPDETILRVFRFAQAEVSTNPIFLVLCGQGTCSIGAGNLESKTGESLRTWPRQRWSCRRRHLPAPGAGSFPAVCSQRFFSWVMP